ncbi:hypothetical protein OAO18_08155 [Francisellaceae bacterium]|nr:hypothetical protein [Francisellaceae bacterium]
MIKKTLSSLIVLSSLASVSSMAFWNHTHVNQYVAYDGDKSLNTPLFRGDGIDHETNKKYSDDGMSNLPHFGLGGYLVSPDGYNIGKVSVWRSWNEPFWINLANRVTLATSNVTERGVYNGRYKYDISYEPIDNPDSDYTFDGIYATNGSDLNVGYFIQAKREDDIGQKIFDVVMNMFGKAVGAGSITGGIALPAYEDSTDQISVVWKVSSGKKSNIKIPKGSYINSCNNTHVTHSKHGLAQLDRYTLSAECKNGGGNSVYSELDITPLSSNPDAGTVWNNQGHLKLSLN